MNIGLRLRSLDLVTPAATDNADENYNSSSSANRRNGNDMEPIQLDSTDHQAVAALVTSLMQTQSTEYLVLNEHQEDITHEIKKLVSFKARMAKGR